MALQAKQKLDEKRKNAIIGWVMLIGLGLVVWVIGK